MFETFDTVFATYSGQTKLFNWVHSKVLSDQGRRSRSNRSSRSNGTSRSRGSNGYRQEALNNGFGRVYRLGSFKGSKRLETTDLTWTASGMTCIRSGRSDWSISWIW